jgi:hypothetical protein
MLLSERLMCGLLVTAVALPLFGQPAAEVETSSIEPPGQLIRDVVFNELHDRERDSHWEYRSDCSSPGRSYVREQVETDRGPVFRIVSENGQPLDADARLREDRRLDQYIHDPAEIARTEHAHEEDEDRLGNAIAIMPQALLFTYQSAPANDVALLAFRPNPAYSPSGIEARIIHALTGTVTVNVKLKRMIEMRGIVSERIDFGYGLLGQVQKGGTFTIHRSQVSAAHWKTDLVDLHIQGRILLLKTVGKVQREARSDFRPVPGDTTPVDAMKMLNRADAQAVQARLAAAPAATNRIGAKD